ncbi:MAG: hypothetical protein V1911_03835, partial [Candidatus Micrarchaeota archaeon]
LGKRLESFYIFGSYAFGKVSLDRPDINLLFIFKEKAGPKDFLKIGELCRETADKFQDKCSVRFEFRPFRYLYPKVKREYDIFINPAITDMASIQATGVVFQKWFTEGLKNANKLVHGSDVLKTIKVGDVTTEDLMKFGMMDLLFFQLPLERAPAQYGKSESEFLLNESLCNAKNIAYLGIEMAMTDGELKQKKYVEYIQDKQKMIDFYKERYGAELSKKVAKVLDARDNYIKYKNSRAKAEEIFGIALELADAVKYKLFSRAKH